MSVFYYYPKKYLSLWHTKNRMRCIREWWSSGFSFSTLWLSNRDGKSKALFPWILVIQHQLSAACMSSNLLLTNNFLLMAAVIHGALCLGGWICEWLLVTASLHNLPGTQTAGPSRSDLQPNTRKGVWLCVCLDLGSCLLKEGWEGLQATLQVKLPD